MINHSEINIIIPAKNEEKTLKSLTDDIASKYPDINITVINDGSTDGTANIAFNSNVTLISHPYSMGNGASIKTGARNSSSKYLIFMDADGQHQPDEIKFFIDNLNNGFDMVVGARHSSDQASFSRKLANYIYNKMATYMTGHDIQDLTSGFRAVKSKKFKRFLYLLPNGFSYPTTSTMAFFRNGYSIKYIPINVTQRKGNSHISILKDGIKFFTIILKIGALFSPMRLFLPISFALFTVGINYYIYTYFSFGRFTNMSALLLVTSILTFLMGIISEQISALHYKNGES
jgi:glycosyltransferase involved in cell wall biosynthesis